MSTEGEHSERSASEPDRAFPDGGPSGSEFPVPDATPPEIFVLPEIVSATEQAEAAAARAEQHARQQRSMRPPESQPAPSDEAAPTVRRVDGSAALRAPTRRPRVRRVTRVVRHIDPWSTFKVALLFSLVGYLVALTSGVLLWRVADATGTLDNVERWFTQFGWETFELQGGEIFHNAWIIGLFVVVATTGGLVLLATVFNLVSDIIGGVRITVLEEEVVERTISSTRRYVVRQGPTARSEAWNVDDDPAPVDWSATRSPSSTAPVDWSVDD